MNRKHRSILIWLLLTCSISAASLEAAENSLAVAVAANFAPTMRALAPIFERQQAIKLNLSVSSSGKHYAQIRQGAPFDVFLAADSYYPSRLEQEGFAVRDSRFTYAVGRLVLWSANPDGVDQEGQVLRSNRFRHLAIANPKLAPYGQAAQAVLTQMGVWAEVQSKLVRGENVAQTLHYVHSGAADLGFVSLAQVQGPEKAREGSYWLVPLSLYPPIEQQAVIVEPSDEAATFIAFIQSPAVRAMMQSYGYLKDPTDSD